MPTLTTHKQLAQRKINVANVPVVLYSCPANTTTFIHLICIVNINAGAAKSYWLFLNPNSQTAVDNDQNTLIDTESVNAHTHVFHEFNDECGLVLSKSGASLLAMSPTAGDIVISVFGKEIVET